MSIKVKNNNVGIAPRKVRQVCDLVRNKKASDALKILRFCEKKEIALMLTKLINSGLAIASNDSKYDLDNLVVGTIFTDEGPMLKRWLPRAMGRATPIQKKMSHVAIILEEKEEFGRYRAPQAKITKSEKTLAKDKEEIKTKETKHNKPSPKVAETKKKPKEGFTRKIFRRKEIA